MLSVNVLTVPCSQQQKDVKQHVKTTTGEPEGCERVIRRGWAQRVKACTNSSLLSFSK